MKFELFLTQIKEKQTTSHLMVLQRYRFTLFLCHCYRFRLLVRNIDILVDLCSWQVANFSRYSCAQSLPHGVSCAERFLFVWWLILTILQHVGNFVCLRSRKRAQFNRLQTKQGWLERFQENNDHIQLTTPVILKRCVITWGQLKKGGDQQGVFAKSNLFESMGLCEAHCWVLLQREV